MTLQLVITRSQDGGFRVLEMGLNETTGMGETLRSHDLQPEISADMAAKYIAKVLGELKSAGGK